MPSSSDKTPAQPIDPKGRFTSRVEAYVRARPSYPADIAAALQASCGLTPACVVADIGSGTGLLTRVFLDNGCTVYGVEPNAAMRAEGERELSRYSRFRSIDGSAEATALPAASVDLVVAGQAFHWFDPTETRREFLRILKPGGWVALIWNDRLTEGSPFLEAYEKFVREFSTDYAKVNHRNIKEDRLRFFFEPDPLLYMEFPNRQDLDAEGFRDRILSSSYMPGPDHVAHQKMLAELERIFAAHQQAGKVAILYRTQVWHGHLSPLR